MADINENKLDQATINQIKQELIARKENIENELKQITEEGDNETLSTKFPDFGDKPDENAQEIGEYTTNLATDKVLESTLRDINASLERIEKGEYGICKYCGKEIGKKRLLARPVASACIECKLKIQKEA